MGEPAGDALGLAHGAGASRDALLEGAIILVGEAVIVLDEIGAALGELEREISQFARGHALRLQRRTGHRSPLGPGELAQTVEPAVRAAEGREQRCGNLCVHQRNIVVHRGVAEQNIQQLAGVPADRAGAKLDGHVEIAAARVRNRPHLADDLLEDRRIANPGERHFDALLDGDVSRAILDGVRVGANAIMRCYVRARLRSAHRSPVMPAHFAAAAAAYESLRARPGLISQGKGARATRRTRLRPALATKIAILSSKLRGSACERAVA